MELFCHGHEEKYKSAIAISFIFTSSIIKTKDLQILQINHIPALRQSRQTYGWIVVRNGT